MKARFKTLILMVGLTSIFCMLSLQAAQYQPPAIHPFEWPESPPEIQGIDSSIIDRVMKQAEHMPYIRGLLIIKNGYLIGERYFHFFTGNNYQTVQSVSKSILSAIVGLAVEQGFINGLDQKIMDFFPDYASAVVDRRFFDVTIYQLLTMTAGLPPSESPPGVKNPYEIGFRADVDPVRYIFEHPLDNNPGEVFNYANTSTHLLSVITARATGGSIREFAERYLFNPLGIGIRQWDQDPQGYHYGGFGMYFVPRDLARFGQLYLRKGSMDGVRILSESWIEDSLTFQSQAYRFEYGYLWRIFNILGQDLYFAWGYGGQFILNIPGLDMVVVITADPYPIRLDSGIHSDKIFKLMLHQILFPILSSLENPPGSPQDARAQKIENRGLFRRQYFNLLSWRPNPRNGAVNVTGYRIYQLAHRIVDLSNNDWILLGEVQAGTYRYRHPVVEEDRICYYAITAVTDDGKESIASVCSCQYPQDR